MKEKEKSRNDVLCVTVYDDKKRFWNVFVETMDCKFVGRVSLAEKRGSEEAAGR